jgi:hypothetical protein
MMGGPDLAARSLHEPEAPMSAWDMKIIAAEAERLIAMSAQDAGLRDELRALAVRILNETEIPRTYPSNAARVLAESADLEGRSDEARLSESLGEVEHPVPDPAGADGDAPGQVREPLRELTLGRKAESAVLRPVSSSRRPPADSDPDEFEPIAERCRAKCDALRWQVECHRRVWEGVESPVEEVAIDPEMVAWAGRLVDCFYWLDDQEASGSIDLSLLDDVAGCFEAVAVSLRLMPRNEGRRGGMERALNLLAEGQSMLRRALQRLRAPDDPDQLAVYQIIREEAARNRIFLRKHMRADDLADPAGWPGLLSRIEATATSGHQSRQHGERVGRMREHLESIRRGMDPDKEWRAVIEAVEESIDEGIPPSNREIRDLLLPMIDELPDREDLPPGFRLVLREIDRYLGTRTPSEKVTQGYVPPAEVKEAARLVGGRSAVLIGGIRRHEAQAALKRTLGLKELIWIETKEHQSIEAFEPIIAREDVALVLLAIRWSSHAFGDVRQYCVRHGKPLIRLPGGYGAHQVAVQVLSQASEVLRGA